MVSNLSGNAFGLFVLLTICFVVIGASGYDILDRLSGKKSAEYTPAIATQLVIGVGMMLSAFAYLAWLVYLLGRNLGLF